MEKAKDLDAAISHSDSEADSDKTDEWVPDEQQHQVTITNTGKDGI